MFTPHTKKALNGNYITITHLEKPGTKVGVWAFMVLFWRDREFLLCCWEFIIFLTHFDNIQCTCILQTSISLLTVLTKTINNQYLLQRHLKFELLELQSLSSFTLYIPCPSKQYHNACMPTLALGHKTSKMSHTAS